MTTVDVTAEEIEDAPLLINPKVKDIKPTTRSRLNFALCIVLSIDTLFQLISIVTPGWNVQRGELSSRHESVYYTTVCADTTPLENISTTVCNTWTFLEDFSKVYNVAKDSKKPALVGVYNLLVRHQINVQISWFIVIGTTIFQIIRYIRANEAYPRLTAINAMLLICACSAMYQALYEALVKLDVTSRQAEYLNVEVGFPYSVFIYSVVFMQTCACTVIIIKQIYDYIRHIQLALLETKVQVTTLQMQYEAEVEEFRNYRHMLSGKSRHKGHSRKSHHVARNSKRDICRYKNSMKANENSDRSPVDYEDEHSTRDSFRSSTGQTHNDRDRNVNHSRDLSRRTSDLSDISRDSSMHISNRHDSRHEPFDIAIEQTCLPQRISYGAKHLQSEQMRMRQIHSPPKKDLNGATPEINTDLVNNCTRTSSEQNTIKNKENGIIKDNKRASTESGREHTNDDKFVQPDNSKRTVSAEVHMPSNNGDVL